MSENKNSNGKGDRPRNCFSSMFKSNYDEVNWSQVRTAGLTRAFPNKPFKKSTKKEPNELRECE